MNDCDGAATHLEIWVMFTKYKRELHKQMIQPCHSWYNKHQDMSTSDLNSWSTYNTHGTLAQCCFYVGRASAVSDAGPTLKQHWANVFFVWPQHAGNMDPMMFQSTTLSQYKALSQRFVVVENYVFSLQICVSSGFYYWGFYATLG